MFFGRHAKVVGGYQVREELALSLIMACPGMSGGDFLIKERRRNYLKRLKSMTFLRDIDYVETAAVSLCHNCGAPMTISLRGSGRLVTLWLSCCDNASASGGRAYPVNGLTEY